MVKEETFVPRGRGGGRGGAGKNNCDYFGICTAVILNIHVPQSCALCQASVYSQVVFLNPYTVS